VKGPYDLFASWIKHSKELETFKDMITIKMEGFYVNVDEPSVQIV